MPRQEEEVQEVPRTRQVNVKVTPEEDAAIDRLSKWYDEPKGTVLRKRTIATIMAQDERIRERKARMGWGEENGKTEQATAAEAR